MFIDENAQAAGSYLLGFMCMRINTTADLNDLNKLLESEKQVISTFFHEYIHFLQNFTSTSGLYSSIFTTQFVKYAVSQVKGIKSDSIILPLIPDESFNRSAQDQLNQIYRGEATLIRNVIYNCYYEQKISLDSGSGQFINVTKYEVNVTSYDARIDYNYHFGATALKEYVAHTLQNQFFPTQHSDTPYLLAGLILDKELPKFTDIRLRITLCDASLHRPEHADPLIPDLV